MMSQEPPDGNPHPLDSGAPFAYFPLAFEIKRGECRV